MQVHCSLKHWKGESLMGDIDLHLHENTLECKFVAFCYTKQKKKSTSSRIDSCQSGQSMWSETNCSRSVPFGKISRLRPTRCAVGWVLTRTDDSSFIGRQSSRFFLWRHSWALWEWVDRFGGRGSLICFAALNWLSRVFDVGPLRRLFGEKTFGNRKRTQKSFRHEKNIFFFCVREHTLNKETSVFCCSFAKYSFLMFSGPWLCASPMMLSWN